MDPRRLQRAGLQWGGLALVAILGVALTFVRTLIDAWHETRPQLVSFEESVNRFSQLKAPELKYPAAAVYFVAFGAALVGLIGWLVVKGLREAMAPEPEAPGDVNDDR
jgi:hypothetical protein